MFGHAFTSTNHGAPPESSTKSYRTSSNRPPAPSTVAFGVMADATADDVVSTTDSIRERTRSHSRGDSRDANAATLGD